MSANDIARTVVGYYVNSRNTTTYYKTLIDCLTLIPNCLIPNFNNLRSMTDEDKQKQKKTEFPMFCVSGVCEQGKSRKADNIKWVNNLMLLDIDYKDNLNISMDNLKECLFRLPYVYAVSKSIRGKGIFVIILIEDTNRFEAHFRAIEREFAAFRITLDASCKDRIRGRYLSYDPDILIKRDCILTAYSNTYNDPEIIKVPNLNIHRGNTLADDDIFVYNCIEKLIDNGYSVDGYNEWLIEAFRLSTLGSIGEDLFLHLSRNSTGYKSDQEAINKFKNAARTTHFDRESAVLHYFYLAKKYFGDNWINKIKGK